MSDDTRTAAEAQATDWIIRQRDPAFADWDSFAEWLAEDPAHADFYDALASLDRDLDALTSSHEPPSIVIRPQAPSRPSRRRWFGGALAAALVAVIAVPQSGLLDGANRIETAAGEHRTVKLPDGSSIEINGGSVVELDKERPRFARLESGEAMFHVVHRENDPFVVEAGAARIVDLGTAFNVVRRDRSTSVAVSEGVVLYSPERDKVRVTAGQAIDATDDDVNPPRVRTVDVANVGGWRTGLLVYNGTSLAIVAEDLRRTAGIDISIAPSAAGQVFRGAMIIDEDRARTVADLAALSETKAERRGDGWVLTR